LQYRDSYAIIGRKGVTEKAVSAEAFCRKGVAKCSAYILGNESQVNSFPVKLFSGYSLADKGILW
jgi:hypothetical protein